MSTQQQRITVTCPPRAGSPAEADRFELVIDSPAGGTGDPSPAGTVLLLHGWPDTLALWDPTVAVLAARRRCLRFTLPGFAAGDAPHAHTLDEVTARLRAAVLQGNGGRPVTLLLHDWGCFFGYHFAAQHPELVERVIGVDIGDVGSRAHRAGLNLRAQLGLVAYQWVLAAAWRIGGPVGDAIARRLARAMHVPTPAADIRAAMGYPYWIAWTGRHGSYRAARRPDLALPMLFIYGQRKAFLFHSAAWAQALAARPGCQVLGLPTGHWVMLEAPAAFHTAVVDWLDGGVRI